MQVESKSIPDIARELAHLQQLAAAGKLSSLDVTGGSITISNIGESDCKQEASREREQQLPTSRQRPPVAAPHMTHDKHIVLSVGCNTELFAPIDSPEGLLQLVGPDPWVLRGLGNGE